VNIKEQLCEAVRIFQEDNGISNQEIYDNTSINKTQLHYIKNCGGENVSLSKIEEILNWMGYDTVMQFNISDSFLDDNSVDFYECLNDLKK
jgi:hypothetical protein